jgi:hypothetical protein
MWARISTHDPNWFKSFHAAIAVMQSEFGSQRTLYVLHGHHRHDSRRSDYKRADFIGLGLPLTFALN